MSELIAAINAAGPGISARSGEIEQLRQLPDDVLAWIYDLQLFKLFVPEALGGRMTPLPEALRAFEALSAIDGSLGWLVHIGAAGGFFVPSFSHDMAAELFADPRAVIAGSGYPAGTARPVAGGYIVNGRWKYASGARHATVFTANAVVVDDASAASGATADEAAADVQVIRAFAFTPDEVQIEQDWHAFGLKATSSDSMIVTDIFVPAERSFVVGEVRWDLTDPIYRVPFMTVAESTIAAVCVGLARRFFELVQAVPRYRDLDALPRLVSRAEQLRAMFHTIADHAWLELVRDCVLPPNTVSTLGATAKHVAHELRNMVQALFPKLGMPVLWETDDLNRVYRDLETACHHVYLSE